MGLEDDVHSDKSEFLKDTDLPDLFSLNSP
jgi:hypothetical protein